jgi:hypothetical protein
MSPDNKGPGRDDVFEKRKDHTDMRNYNILGYGIANEVPGHVEPLSRAVATFSRTIARFLCTKEETSAGLSVAPTQAPRIVRLAADWRIKPQLRGAPRLRAALENAAPHRGERAMGRIDRDRHVRCSSASDRCILPDAVRPGPPIAPALRAWRIPPVALDRVAKPG